MISSVTLPPYSSLDPLVKKMPSDSTRPFRALRPYRRSQRKHDCRIAWVNFGSHLRDAHGNLVHPGDPRIYSTSSQTKARPAQKAFAPVAAAIDCSLWHYSRRCEWL